MRIVLVFLMLIVVSVAGVGMLASNSGRIGLPSLTEGADNPLSRTSAQAALEQPAAQPAAQPVVQPTAPPARTEPSVAAAPVPQPVAPGEAVTFTINSGETTGTIAERLSQMGLIPNALLFRFWVQWKGAEGRLQAGDYQLRQGMSMDDLINVLQTAKAIDVAITFVEGRRIEEFAELLEKSETGIDARRFLDLVKRGNFTYDFLEGKPAGASLEGFLFPDTYRVIPGKTTPEELIHQMLKRFGESFSPQLREAAKRNNNLSVYDTVILASIIEREAAVKDERPRIASAYTNRLRDGEGLFADPTIQYAVGKQGDWWPVLRDVPRNIVPTSRYNTYVFAGLPPSPICNPGAASIRAAAEPEKTNYKYFVRDDIKNDGSHVFAQTLAQHEENRRRFSRQ